ncbi:MAG: MFS transporter [Thermomicrobiales bacterium]
MQPETDPFPESLAVTGGAPNQSSLHRRLPLTTLLIANAVSLSGEAVTAVAIPWYVYTTTGSAAQMGLVGFFTVLPRVLATFFGGALVDRIGFRRTSVTADMLSGLAIAGIPLLSGAGLLSFPTLLALVFLGAVFDGPGATARESMAPELAAHAGVPLARVNAIYQTVQRLALLIGPALAGVLIVAFGATRVLWIDAVTFAVSALLVGVGTQGVALPGPPPEQRPYWQDLTTGLRAIMADPLLRALAVVLCFLNFVEAPLVAVALPVLVRERFGSAETFGVLVSALGAGAVVGSLVYAAIGPRYSRYRVFSLAYLAVGLPYWVLAATPSVVIAIGAMVAMGLAAAPLNPILMTVRQERVTETARARVFGTMTAVAFVAIPLGQLVGGLVIESAGVTTAFMLMGALFLITTLAIRLLPVLRQMDATPSFGPASEAR